MHSTPIVFRRKSDRGTFMTILSKTPMAIMTILMVLAPLSGCLSFAKDEDSVEMGGEWIDPVIEIENDNHSHNDLLAHRMATSNAKLIDYHNLNCDGKVKPDAEIDGQEGRPCLEEFKNTGPTPGDNSEIAIEGNFMEDCQIYGDGSGG